MKGLLLDLIGATRRTRQTLELLFENRTGGRYRFVDSSRARAVIVDLDGLRAREEWCRYREQYPERPALLLSLQEHPCEEPDQMIRKPFRSGDLLQALARLESSLPDTLADNMSLTATGGGASPAPLPVATPAAVVPLRPGTSPSGEERTTPTRERRHTPMVSRTTGGVMEPGSRTTGSISEPGSRTMAGFFDLTAVVPDNDIPEQERFREICGEHPDIDPEDAQAVAGILLDDRDHLLRRLRNILLATSDSSPTRLLTLRGQHHLLLYGVDEIHSDLTDNALKALAGVPITDEEIEIAPRPISPGEVPWNGAMISQRTDAFLWKLSLWTYRGRLPAGFDLEQRVYLRHWPNLTRLLEVPDAMRISALWLEHPMTLPFTARALQIPQRHVFAFYNAAHSIGLAGIVKRESDALMEQSIPHRSPQRGLFNRVLDHLQRSLRRRKNQDRPR